MHIVEKRNLWFAISALVIGIGLVLMVFRAFQQQPILNFGIDFTGGSTLLVKSVDATQPLTLMDVPPLREVLSDFGVEHHHVQLTQGHELLIKTQLLQHETRQAIFEAAQAQVGALDLLEADTIGPSIGYQLKRQAFWMIGLVCLVLLLYITWRFEWIYGLSAILAVVHDAFVTLSVAALMDIEVNTAFVAALLMILGYSINDTIVVFDRIRENTKKQATVAITLLANQSIRQTLMRSIYTSVTTLMVIGSLLVFGGITLRGFCWVLVIGVLAGTYSSIFIASPLVTIFYKPPPPD